MASTIYPVPTSGGTNIGTLAGGTLVFTSTQTGTTIQFTTVYPMAAGAYEFTFKRLACINTSTLKIALSLNGTATTSTTISNPPGNYGTVTVYLTSPTDFDTVSLYNGGNVFQSDGTSTTNAALTITAGRRSVSKVDNLSWTRLADSPTITASTPPLYAAYPGYYGFAVANTAGTKIYYSYENAFDGSATPAVQPKMFEYDIATNTHTEKAALPVTGGNNTWCARNVIFVNGKLYMQGGTYWNGSAWTYMTSLWEYDPTANTWTSKLAGGPSGYSYVYSPNSTTINYFTSWQSQTGNSTTSHWSYNITANTWSTLAAPATTWNTTNTVSYPNRDIGQADQRESRAWFYDQTANIFWMAFSSSSTTANYPIYLKYTVSTNTWSLDDNLTRNPSFHSTAGQYGYSLDNRNANTAGTGLQSFEVQPQGYYPQKQPQPKIGSNFITYSNRLTGSGASVPRFLTLPANNPFYGSVIPTYTGADLYASYGYLIVGTKIYGFMAASNGINMALYVTDTASLVTQPSYAI